VIHVAGTNGKTTVVRMVADILGAHGLFTGSFISPHLHRVEDRYALGGTAFGKTHLSRAVEDVAPFVVMQEEQFGEHPTYFELTAAVGFEAFRVDAVDVAVVEVGLGGRYDATNVVEADVSVITGVAIDHTSYLGDTQSKIAAEKAAILKEAGVLVTGPLGSEAKAAVEARVSETSSAWHSAPDGFRVAAAERDERGWVVSIQGLHADYDDLILGIHGRHQVTHLATAIAACEAFFGRALDEDAVREAAATVRSPGRLEVAGLEPTILIDGAHNEEGFRGLAETLATEFDEEHWTLVIGLRGNRDAAALLAPLRGKISKVVATKADDRMAVDPARLLAAAEQALGVRGETRESVPAALQVGRGGLAPDEGLLVAGSLYVVGEARHAMGLDNAPSPVHRRFEAEIPFE
jgi:dihydrofolate synthase/folylpolyglutamate synthase